MNGELVADNYLIFIRPLYTNVVFKMKKKIYFINYLFNVYFPFARQLITMFFGANDLCSGQCYDKDGTTPLQHSKKLQKALDYLQANLPRTLVNLVPVLGECSTCVCVYAFLNVKYSYTYLV